MGVEKIFIKVHAHVTYTELESALKPLPLTLDYWTDDKGIGLFAVPTGQQQSLIDEVRIIPGVKYCEPQIVHDH